MVTLRRRFSKPSANRSGAVWWKIEPLNTRPRSRRRRSRSVALPSAGLQVGRVRRDPEIEADVGLVGMDVDARSLMLADERPPVAQVMSAQQLGHGLPQLRSDLQQQRAEEAGFGICPDIAGRVRPAPNRRSQAEALQLGERFRCQQMVDAGDPFALAFEGFYDIAPIIRGLRQTAGGASSCITSGGSAMIRPYWPPRGIVGISPPACRAPG
jgi:hypothetical protein